MYATLHFKGNLECSGTSLLGIITRCPLVLKLKKQLACEFPWRGKISYRNMELQLQDPSQVEREIYKGRVHFCRLGAGAAPLTALPPLRLMGLPQLHKGAHVPCQALPLTLPPMLSSPFT